jgi:hypothetical protein
MAARSKTITASMLGFIGSTGREGATLPGIYAAVHADLGEEIRNTSIRVIIYQKLFRIKRSTRKRYKPSLERIVVHEESRYRLLELPIT